MVKTENFNPETDPKLKCTCGHGWCDKRSVSQIHLNRIQEVRDKANRPLIVTSGGRCKHHPDESRKSKPGDHFKGNALDIKVSGGLERGELVKFGIEAGCNAIGIAKTFVHLGYRPELRTGEIVMWVY